ncbi:MAG: type IV pilus assembly protein PilM [Candidatus Moranbacteria bacterium]|nr:type IV pilus assembly protein PilM [Candidatus Moranbacteria bacterium]MDD3964779.1 type IV pilus assembly protein PilM [Candidatus Moranbacteria bacterium]
MSILQKNFFNVFPNAFGLDLSDLSIKAVWLERMGKLDSISSFGSVPLPLGSVVDGEIVNPDAVQSAIIDLLDKTGPGRITTRKVICSLPETKAFLRIISIPMMASKEVKEAIKWEIEANIPLTLDQVYYDWQILDENFIQEKGKMSVLVVAVARSVVDQFQSVLTSAGLEVVGLETESIAQARSLLAEKNEKQTTLIVDIGDRRSSFLIAIGSTTCFTSSVPLSSQMITDAISKSLQIPFGEAEEIKIKQGLGSLALQSPVLKAALPVLESIATEIERSIDFYLSNLHYSENIDSIVLCGGGANMQGLVPFLSRRLGRLVEFGDPWVNVNLGKKIPLIDHNRSVQYSTAIGLALRGLDEYENFA